VKGIRHGGGGEGTGHNVKRYMIHNTAEGRMKSFSRQAGPPSNGL
jgi:hypothetical protein